jgi:hypothetical protein
MRMPEEESNSTAYDIGEDATGTCEEHLVLELPGSLVPGLAKIVVNSGDCLPGVDVGRHAGLVIDP